MMGYPLKAGRSWARLKAALGDSRGVIAGTIIALILAGWGLSHWAMQTRSVSTEDALVRADVSMISASVGGHVRTLAVEDNQLVHTRDVLLEIEPDDYQSDLAEAEADLARAQRALPAHQAARARAMADMERYRVLAERGFLSPAGWQAIVARERAASHGEAAAAAALESAQARIDAASRDIDRTIVRAPIDGVIVERRVQIGQVVQEGAPLMEIAPLQSMYVLAAFDEAQIALLRPGQSATIELPLERQTRLSGRVESIAPNSAVHVSIDPNQPGAEVLRPGLSVAVTVDTQAAQ